MVQIIQGGLRQPNPLGQGLSQLANQLQQQKLMKQQQAQQEQQSGILSRALFGNVSPEELAKLKPEYQLKVAENENRQLTREQNELLKKQQQDLKTQEQNQKQELKIQEQNQKIQEKTEPLLGALERIQAMRNIGKRGNLGLTSGVRKIYSGDTRKDIAEYEQLGKSLISFASAIPIRNKAEFETMASQIHDPSLTDETREGMLNALQKTIYDGLKSVVGPKKAEELMQGYNVENKEAQQQQMQPEAIGESLNDFKAQEGQKAVDNETGETFIFKNGKWEPIK